MAKEAGELPGSLGGAKGGGQHPRLPDRRPPEPQPDNDIL